uniref:N(4)-(Beta-N-acetylglucosaminyl)-L-asparaginase n=1 Tax=Globisporangium ultimum (strain ATCC 200006 / CBS 805.95 / DAOM BR144) TaxID=431595 RepID=K3X096_GLOUD
MARKQSRAPSLRILALLVVATALRAVHCAHAAAVVINTWPFANATRVAFAALTASSPQQHLDAITVGCNRCEVEQCDFTVGYGGSPDTNGETTLDAMILDGTTMDMGAVAQLRRIKAAIHVARAVLHHTSHSILAGDGALEFAKMMGFQEESLVTPYSRALHAEWKQQHCQPNYFRNVVPAQNSSCPPFKPAGWGNDSAMYASSPDEEQQRVQALVTQQNHDTIGMVVLDTKGDMAAGTSSNGANHKVAGRVGDAAVPGAGAYVDSAIGGAAATGDGDVMMRFLPSFHAVQEMAKGVHPRVACERALVRIASKYPHFKGGMVCLNRMGEFGGAGHGWNFSFTVQATGMSEPTVVHVDSIALA